MIVIKIKYIVIMLFYNKNYCRNIMCGISGFFNNKKKKIDKTLLIKLSKTLIHRGPDFQGKYYKSMAHNIFRFSENGNQPFSNERYHISW